MTKFDLDTSKSLCKSIFDHCRKAGKTDTNRDHTGSGVTGEDHLEPSLLNYGMFYAYNSLLIFIIIFHRLAITCT